MTKDIEEFRGGAKVRDRLDIRLAVDGDLNALWEKSDGSFKSPRQRITINEALVAQSVHQDIDDVKLPENN